MPHTGAQDNEFQSVDGFSIMHHGGNRFDYAMELGVIAVLTTAREECCHPGNNDGYRLGCRR